MNEQGRCQCTRSRSLYDRMNFQARWWRCACGSKERVEPSKFSCRENECGMLIRIEFRIAREAEEFAERFFHVSDGLPGR